MPLFPLVAVLIVGQVEPAGGPKPPPEVARPEELRAIEQGWFDPAFRPVPGARGVAAYRDVAKGEALPVTAYADPAALARFQATASVGDVHGAFEELRDGSTVLLAPGTEVLVIGEGETPVKLDGRTVPLAFVEIRILEGPQTGRKLLTLGIGIKRLILPDATGPAERPVRLQAHAETLLRSGRNLEAAGKLEGARAFYRRIVAEYPGTDSARTAQDRLGAIGKGK